MSAARIWWITEAVVGGPNPSLAELTDLRSQGFSTLVCLLDRGEPPAYDPYAARTAGYDFHHLSIADFGAPSPAQFQAFLDIAGQAAGKLLVHCWGGLGRTGTMGAALYIAGGASATAAIAEIRARRPGAIQSAIQQQALAALEAAQP